MAVAVSYLLSALQWHFHATSTEILRQFHGTSMDLPQHFQGIRASIRIGREIQCLPYARFLTDPVYPGLFYKQPCRSFIDLVSPSAFSSESS